MSTEIRDEKTMEMAESLLKRAPYKLPDCWRWVRLGEVCEIDSNQVQPNTELAKRLPYIGLEHIESGTGKIIEKINNQNGKPVQSITFRFDSRHVLYGKLRPYLNKVAIPGFEGRCSTELLPLLPENGCNRYYLVWALRRDETVEEAMRHKTGTRMPRADMDDLFKMLVPLPPLPEQQRIAARLQELMREVERARTACEKQLEAAKGLPAAYLRAVFESEEAEKWERKRLREVCEIILGQSPPGSTYNRENIGLPFFQGKIDFGLVYPVPSTWCSKPIKIAQPSDILISVRAPVGPTNMANQKCCIGRGLAAIRPNGNIAPGFVFYFFRFIESGLSEKYGGRGSTFGAMTREHLQELEIPLPPLPEQKRFSTDLTAKMSEVEKLRQSIENRLEAINALPQAILQKAFRGEL